MVDFVWDIYIYGIPTWRRLLSRRIYVGFMYERGFTFTFLIFSKIVISNLTTCVVLLVVGFLGEKI